MVEDTQETVLVHLRYLRGELKQHRDEFREQIGKVDQKTQDVRRDLEKLRVRRHEADLSIEQRLASLEHGVKLALTGGVGVGAGFPALTWLFSAFGG